MHVRKMFKAEVAEAVLDIITKIEDGSVKTMKTQETEALFKKLDEVWK
jgi:hypothetical protein